MNFKYLSKYHYIYRLSFHDNYTVHIEKFPIAYANKTYVYIIEPGNPELRRLTLTPTVAYWHGDIYTEVNDEVKDAISKCLRFKNGCFRSMYWFLVDNLESLKELIDEFRNKTLEKLYLEKERDRLDLSVRNAKFNLDKRTEELENVIARIEKLEKA